MLLLWVMCPSAHDQNLKCLSVFSGLAFVILLTADTKCCPKDRTLFWRSLTVTAAGSISLCKYLGLLQLFSLLAMLQLSAAGVSHFAHVRPVFPTESKGNQSLLTCVLECLTQDTDISVSDFWHPQGALTLDSLLSIQHFWTVPSSLCKAGWLKPLKSGAGVQWLFPVCSFLGTCTALPLQTGTEDLGKLESSKMELVVPMLCFAHWH